MKHSHYSISHHRLRVKPVSRRVLKHLLAHRRRQRRLVQQQIRTRAELSIRIFPKSLQLSSDLPLGRRVTRGRTRHATDATVRVR